jgi:glycosyltransferase involved in cell wall biosynthesis
MSHHRFSVALCTFNGARFLRQQLESVALQRLPPCELVVCDDASQDGSGRIIEDFSDAAPFPVRLTLNKTRLGSTRNFEQAIRACCGDIIALCDQDDVWREDKLSVLDSSFSSKPDVGLAFSDAEMADALLRPLGYRLWQSLNFSSKEQRRFSCGRSAEILLKHNVITGATLAFRTSLRSLVLPIPEGWVHDGWIGLVLSAHSKLSLIEEPLIKYRQHSANQLGATRKSFPERLAAARRKNWQTYLGHSCQFRAVLERWQNSPDPVHPFLLAKIEEKIAHVEARGTMPVSRIRRLPSVLRELVTLRYFRYSDGARSFARDLFLST